MEKLDNVREKDLRILINDVVKDEGFINKDGNIKEPFRTFLILKLLSARPVRSILMLSHIFERRQIVTRSDLASFLGPEFKEGQKYMEIGRWLECLEKLQVLEGTDTERRGRKTKGFRIKGLELHLCCETLQTILDGKGVGWSQLDVMKIVTQKFDPKKKIRDSLGREIVFDSIGLIERVIKSDVSSEVNFKNALSISEKVSREIREGKCRDLQTVHKIVIDELEKISLSAYRKYLETNPPSLILKGKGYEGLMLNYDTVNRILDKSLSKYKIKHLSPKMRESIITATLRKFMIGVGKSREIDLEKILQKIDTTIFDLYGETLQDITGNPQQHIQRAYLFLSLAKDKMETSEVYKAVQPLQCSLSCCLTPIYLKLGLLPPKDEISTISLTRDVIFPETVQMTENVEKIKTELQSVEKGIRGLFTKEKVDLDDFQKSVECLLSNEIKKVKVDTEGKISEIDEKTLKHNVDFAINFLEKFIPITDKIISAHKTQIL